MALPPIDYVERLAALVDARRLDAVRILPDGTIELTKSVHDATAAAKRPSGDDDDESLLFASADG